MSFILPTALLPDFVNTSQASIMGHTTLSPPPEVYPTSGNAIATSVFSAVLVAANYVPFLSLKRANNIPATTMIAVTMLQMFFVFLNSILWPNNDVANWWDGQILCDIEVYVRTMCATLISTSTAGLTRNLAHAVDTDNPRLYESVASRRRRQLSELLFCFAIPVVQLATYYMISAGRYAVATVYGCTTITDNSWPLIVLFLIWPPIFALLNCYYAILVIIRLRRHHGILSNTLSSNGSSFTAQKFMKLLLISLTVLVIYLPVTLAFFYFNLPLPLHSYSWHGVHNQQVWGIILFITDIDYPRLAYYGWASIAQGLILFLCFGLNHEAIEMYRRFLGIWCGFGKFWPGLLKPRVHVMPQSGSRSSWSNRLDVVGKALRYFDSGRKGSNTGSMGLASDCSRSRKGSAATFEHLAMNDLSPASQFGSAVHTMPDHQDLITPAPSLASRAYLVSSSNTQRSEPSLQRHPFLSAFRTHLNVQFQFLDHRKQTTDDHDLEAQPKRFSIPLDHHTVETNIWSDPTTSPKAAVENESPLDPLSPKLGSRAYRERERRERDIERTAAHLFSTSATIPEEGVTVSKTLDQSSCP